MANYRQFTECCDTDDSHKADLITVASLSHECKLREVQLTATKQEISRLEQEVEKLRLERQWCYDDEGNRTVPTAEQQAVEISEKLAAHPELIEDIVKALRMKKIDLQCNLKELQLRCNAMKDDIH